MNPNLGLDFIVNQGQENHLCQIKAQIEASTEVWMAVAFLKTSGLKLLEPTIKDAIAKGIRFRVICGLDMYITEPAAVRLLQDWFQAGEGHDLRLMPADGKKTFHAKVYCFHKLTGEVTLLVGSANLTRGGVRMNDEASLLIYANQDSQVYDQVRAFFEGCAENAQEFSELMLSKYAGEFETHQKKKREAEREIKAVPLSIQSLDSYKEAYLADEEEQRDFAHRSEKYVEARQVLMSVITESISSREEFMKYYERLVKKEGREGLWHSGSVYRKKNIVADNYPLFIQMVRDIQRNLELLPTELFRIGLEHKKRVKGVGVNIMTEVMHTFAPDRFPVLNQNPRDGLLYFGLEHFPHPQTFKPETYMRYTVLMKDIQAACDFEDLGRVDHFFNYLYWKYVKKQQD